MKRVKFVILGFLSAVLLMASGVSASNHPLPVPTNRIAGLSTVVITYLPTDTIATVIAGHHATQTAIAQQSPTPTP